MSRHITIAPTGLTRWVQFEPAPADALDVVRRNATVEVVAAAFADNEDVSVVSVSLNESGTVEQMPGLVATDLPPFCDVRLAQRTPGGHTAQITVWIPLDWNERFLGLGGQGNRASVPWVFGELVRLATLPNALRNGFATAETDSGNQDPRFAGWGLDDETRELDWELIRNWQDRSTHDMTVIAKAAIEAVHGRAPRFAYFQGTSGGGRQAMMEAQRYPEDYDGIWSADPALNWSKFIVAEIWPALVMKEAGNPLPPAKLEAFRAGYLAADGVDPDAARAGYVGAVEPPSWDPREIVGTSTSAGPITAEDAEVMATIWSGPHSRDGERLWFGLRPDTESWADNIHTTGLAMTEEVDGELAPAPFVMALAYIGGWLLRDPAWDWRTLTYEQFEEVFAHSASTFGDLDTDQADISPLGDRGSKLILSHGLSDEVIFAAGSTSYADSVFDELGAAAVEPFFRAYFTPGDGHSHVTAAGPGLTLAGGMTALMAWVEDGEAPEVLDVERYDRHTGEVTARGTVSPYRPTSG